MAPNKGQNLPTDYNFSASKLAEGWGTMGKTHEYKDGEYREIPYVDLGYPKAKYHEDYVHVKSPLKEYGFTESAQIVKDAAEEAALGPEWKDAPQVITAPNAQQVAATKQAISSNWRSAANLPAETVSEHHVAFAQSQGMTHITSIVDLYKFLNGLTSSQMTGFMKEADAWKPARSKKESN